MASPTKMGEVSTLGSQEFDIELDMTVNGAAGAVPSTLARARGISGVVRNGAGDYSITLSETWTRFCGMVTDTVVTASLTTTLGFRAYVKSEAVATTKIIRVQFVRPDTGAAADVDNNARILLTFRVANSDV